jgi:hypothetical protein
VARCLVRHAEVAALAGDAGAAVDSLDWAVRVYAIAAHAADRRPVELRLAHALLDAGRAKAARQALASALARGPGDGEDEGARVPEVDRAWVEARAAGRVEELAAVRDRLLAEGRVADAVTVAFEVPGAKRFVAGVAGGEGWPGWAGEGGPGSAMEWRLGRLLGEWFD